MSRAVSISVLNNGERVRRWRELARSVEEDPAEVAALATSDLSEEGWFAGWMCGAGRAMQQIALDGGGRCGRIEVSPGDAALLRMLLDRLGGRWPEWPPSASDWFGDGPDDGGDEFVMLNPVTPTVNTPKESP